RVDQRYVFVPSPTASPSPFSVEVRAAYVQDSGQLTRFVVGYQSMFGQTVSPVFYLAYVQITNLQDVVSTVNDFKIAASKDAQGPWEDLVPIPLAQSSTLYALGVKSKGGSGALTTPNGTTRLIDPMSKKDLKLAVVLRANPTLETELVKPIRPHSPIT